VIADDKKAMSEPVSIEEQMEFIRESLNATWHPEGDLYHNLMYAAILATLRAHQKALTVVREQEQEMRSAWTQATAVTELRRLHRAVTGEGE
jgi:hypothetical protein